MYRCTVCTSFGYTDEQRKIYDARRSSNTCSMCYAPIVVGGGGCFGAGRSGGLYGLPRGGGLYGTPISGAHSSTYGIDGPAQPGGNAFCTLCRFAFDHGFRGKRRPPCKIAMVREGPPEEPETEHPEAATTDLEGNPVEFSEASSPPAAVEREYQQMQASAEEGGMEEAVVDQEPGFAPPGADGPRGLTPVVQSPVPGGSNGPRDLAPGGEAAEEDGEAEELHQLRPGDYVSEESEEPEEDGEAEEGEEEEGGEADEEVEEQIPGLVSRIETEGVWFERDEDNVPSVFIKTYQRFDANGQVGGIIHGGFSVELPEGPVMEHTRRVATGYVYVGMGN